MKIALENSATKAKLTKSKWERWFAWRPIILTEEDQKYFLWLETVERRTITEAFLLEEGVPLAFHFYKKYRLKRKKKHAHKS
tara:strand:+ start:1002 stop:1247 length:246 start_codon:yes stop_codon:yes gene_type:complete